MCYCKNVQKRGGYILTSELHIEILVSALGKAGAVRRLEIQWEYAPNNPGDWIGLFNSDPLNYNDNLLEVLPVTSIHGWTNTSIFENHLEPSKLGYQDETVLAQLIYGIRYIDLRVGYYSGNNEQWWANHGVVRIHPLRIVLNDIKTFINNTNEIVILDVQEFPVGFTSIDIHYLLVNFLENELNDLYVPNLGWDATLDQVWKTGKKLIVGYDRREIAVQFNFLWYSVQQKWGNVQSVNKLYSYLSGLIARPPFESWSAMAELTPTTLDIILDRLKGLRVMAESVNHNVTEWFRQKDWQTKSNIVTVDFFRNTGIIRSAIEWNKNHGNCPGY
ncbi:conserved hypothetical protein [Pediculus humanus corporis]|uniref:Uncharacterized protein n=1 Tax=Pediculus humanus subsp. corporis TaxID=121224 RepID=E0V9I2_PEDHC|nr:uncharacterized protein Phum_PHUM012560 [Pediculus humanus corporis]EEB10038.1 conserved hypothetical protein [Pediculus humanus corporis]